MPVVISCVLRSIDLRSTCSAPFLFPDNAVCVTIDQRPYYVIEPIRTVNTVIGPVVFAPHFYECDLVHAVHCRFCSGCIGYEKFGLFYLCNVRETYEAHVMWVDGYDSEESSSSESDRSGDWMSLITELSLSPIFGVIFIFTWILSQLCRELIFYFLFICIL